MAVHIADYKILKDGGFRLGVGETERMAFSLPPGTVIDERAILGYIANPTSSAENLAYEVKIVQRWWDEGRTRGARPDEEEEIVIQTSAFTGGVMRGLWTIIGSGLLLLETPPFQLHGRERHDRGSIMLEVVFSVLSNRDTDIWAEQAPNVRFSDVILWFQRKAGEP